VGELGDLGQVHRLIGDALQMQVDVQQGREQPQVGGDRGLEREQAKDPSFDVQVELVHLVVTPDHLATDRRVAARKGLQRRSNSSWAWVPVRWTSPSRARSSS
jgi:hypothetical protein